MPSVTFELKRSIIIARPPDVVFDSVSDFKTWRTWSPWLSQEPDAKVTITGSAGKVGHGQAWEGQKIGSGRQELVEVDQGRALEYDLAFIKPWKSRSRTGFKFAKDGKGTKVEWWLKGSLPAPLFFMKQKVAGTVGKDFERGLAMLKAELES